MDNTTYYAVAACLSAAALLVSAVNLFILLRDRRERLNVSACYIGQAGGIKIIRPERVLGTRDRTKTKAGLLIRNRSSQPCTIDSVAIEDRAFFGFGPPKNLHEIVGEFAPAEFPQVVPGKSSCVFSFNPDELATRQESFLRVTLVDGGWYGVKIGKAFNIGKDGGPAQLNALEKIYALCRSNR